jgi:hypothetical protein
MKAEEAEEVIQRAQQTGRPLSDDDIPLQVLYSRTTRSIGIRYRLSESQVLEIALALSSHEVTNMTDTDTPSAAQVRS